MSYSFASGKPSADDIDKNAVRYNMMKLKQNKFDENLKKCKNKAIYHDES